MKSPALITGLDIGSSKISCVAAEMDRSGAFKILAQATRPSKGVSRGVIVDFNEAVDSVSKGLGELARLTSRRPEDIYVNVCSDTLRGEVARGMVPLSLRGREVTKADMDRCVNAASTIRLPFDREIIHKIVQGFSIDDQPWIKNPLGLYASRLACEIYAITANVNHVQNIYKCLNAAGYNASELVYTGMADGLSILDETQKEEGALVLGIGAALTEASIFFGGLLRDVHVMPVGMEDLNLERIIASVRTRIEEFSKKGGRINSIALTGGISFTDDIVEVLERGISLPVKIGTAREVTGDISSLDSMKAVTAIGIVRYAHEKLRRKAAEDKNILQHISTKVVDIFNNYF